MHVPFQIIVFIRFFTAKETINEKTTYGLGENICKWCNWQENTFPKYTNCSYNSITKNTQSKMAEDLKSPFPKDDIQMANRHMKRCSISLITRDMQIKTTIRYHLTLVRISIIKKYTNNKHWTGCRENETLWHCWWDCKLVFHYAEQCGDF